MIDYLWLAMKEVKVVEKSMRRHARSSLRMKTDKISNIAYGFDVLNTGRIVNAVPINNHRSVNLMGQIGFGLVDNFKTDSMMDEPFKGSLSVIYILERQEIVK
jgi:hypothetical protein